MWIGLYCNCFCCCSYKVSALIAVVNGLRTCSTYVLSSRKDSSFRMKILQNEAGCVILEHKFWNPSLMRLSEVRTEADKGWESWESIRKSTYLPSSAGFSCLGELFNTDWKRLKGNLEQGLKTQNSFQLVMVMLCGPWDRNQETDSWIAVSLPFVQHSRRIQCWGFCCSWDAAQ